MNKPDTASHASQAMAKLMNPLSTLKSASNTRRALYERLLGKRVIDAVLHLPVSFKKRRLISWVSDAKEGELITIVGRVENHRHASKPGVPYCVTLSDDKRSFDLVFFNGNPMYLVRILPLGEKVAVSGQAQWYEGRLKITHPDHIGPEESASEWTDTEPVYPLSTGLTYRGVRAVIHAALERLNDAGIEEWLVEKPSLSFAQAIWLCHVPKEPEDFLPSHPARQRLAYDELLAHQLALHQARQLKRQGQVGISLPGTGVLRDQLLSILPFELTASQKEALSEISADMTKPKQMLRLVQGDVGSGKTLVALCAMLQAVESGYQAAILAPTDILARQHGSTLTQWGERIGIRVALLTGRDRGKKRDEILADLQNGSIDILIGTHAIIQGDVIFKRLGLAVIDEQHRFGVEQRLALSEKGGFPDTLAMTATPIPRTMQLASYGDMQVSLIREKPAQRQPVKTSLLPLNRLSEVIGGLNRILESKGKVFWVCPLVEESEVIDLAAAESRYEELQEIFGSEVVGLVHGKMKAADKDSVMGQFVSGAVRILVSTTVIEVGVDVPDATVMIIEHADRFGLAQLHQLRGRIGRGSAAGNCLLLYGAALSEVGKKRLEIMRSSHDGFFIAEEDLKLRGGGEIAGTRQSGIPQLRFSDLQEAPEIYEDLLAKANEEARQIIEEDPTLSSPRGKALRLLLEIFEKDEASRYHSG